MDRKDTKRLYCIPDKLVFSLTEVLEDLDDISDCLMLLLIYLIT